MVGYRSQEVDNRWEIIEEFVIDNRSEPEEDELALLKTAIHQHSYVSVTLGNER
jgi:hypothetical protein